MRARIFELCGSDLSHVRGHILRVARCWSFALACAVGFGASANAASLTIGLNVTPTSMDPHFHYASQNTSPLSHVLEPIVSMEGDRTLRPALATSWKAIDNTTWEFKLRQGVKFHDGSDFTAADVVFTYKRVSLVPNSPSSFAIFVRSIAETIVVDPHTIRFRTSVPNAELPIELSQVLILSHVAASGPAPEGKTTAQLNSGNGLVGTGPYRFVSFTPNEGMAVAANPNYWGKKADWDSVTLKVIASDATRAAAILAGDIDAAIVPGESLDRLRADPKVRVTVGDACFFTYLALDQHEPSATITNAGGKNPLRDARVRKALSLAINREAIAQRTLSGLAESAAELGAPTLFAATPDAKPDAFDPDQARKLLSEAGYPSGFGITLHSPNGLFPADSELAQAIGSMWTRVGVRTKVESVAGSMFYSRRNKLEYSAYVTNACPYIGQMSYSVRILAMTRDLAKGNGQINISGYSNADVDRLMGEAFRTIDDDARRALIQKASSIVMKEDHAVLAIVQHRYAYATRQHLAFRPRIDTFLTAMQISPAR